MSDFNLRRLVREVLDNSTMADPRSLAAEVGLRIRPSQYEEALAQCLPEIVREEIGRSRPATGGVLTENPGGGRSAKVSGIREMWRTQLRNRIHVGASEWRMLGDCGFEELMFAAAERRQMAARNAAKAEEYEELAQAVRGAGVARVRDLPADLLRGLSDVA